MLRSGPPPAPAIARSFARRQARARRKALPRRPRPLPPAVPERAATASNRRASPSREPPPGFSRRHRQRSRSHARQRNAEMAARGPAHDADAAAMGLGELARDRKPESGALDAPARFGAPAEKRLEDGVAFLRRHPRPGIDDLDDRLAAVGARKDRDGAATRRELHRVAEQIVENRAQLLR